MNSRIRNMCSRITLSKLIPHPPGTNELILVVKQVTNDKAHIPSTNAFTRIPGKPSYSLHVSEMVKKWVEVIDIPQPTATMGYKLYKISLEIKFGKTC